MNFKLAFKNVRKSIKNYAIYFLTLSFAVCIFYAFNSIGAQGKLLSTKGDKEIIEMMGTVIGYISVFVSVVLGGLIIYANNFLIKRRKKELGLYMSLGMGKRKISSILVLEEVIIGIISLICGILGGIVLSQFLAIITTKLFNVVGKNYSIIFSFDAMIKSIVYFGIIFILVMIFNVVVVSRYKLIDLLTAHKKNEKAKIKSPLIAGIIFIISLIAIGVAYKLVIETGLDIMNLKFKISIALGIVGTILFFYGLTGFIILVIKKIQKIYYKKLNIFTVKQMNSKINTNFISMAVISLMLFITISLISVAVGFRSQNIGQYTPYSASIKTINAVKGYNLNQALKDSGFKLPEGSTASYIQMKNIKGVTLNTELKKYVDIKSNLYSGFLDQPVQFIGLTQYNDAMKQMGKNTITLDENQVMILSNSSFMKSTVNNFFKEKGKINIDGKEYSVKGNGPITEGVSTESGGAYIFTVITNDNVLKNATEQEECLNINYGKNKEQSEEYMQNFFGKYGNRSFQMPNSKDSNYEVFALLQTKTSIEQTQSQMTTMILYIALYIGAIFLVSSAAVLALQQLSEASDSYERYKALRKIGASNGSINKSIFIQTLVYFALPLALALVHASIGIYVANDFIANFGKSSILDASLWSMAGITIIYLGYFIVTYLGYKNIVKEK